MELEKVTAEIRPRSQWEAIDLGVRLASEHAVAVIKGWMASVYPLAALILILCHQSVGWGVFLIWWLKPIWERVALHPLSRSLFGEHPGWRETMKVLPGQMKKNKVLVLMGLALTAIGWWIHHEPSNPANDDYDSGVSPGLAILFWVTVIGLLFYRSSLSRSLVLPIRYLEGLEGARFKTRLQTLSYRSAGAATGLMVICLLLEAAIFFSQIMFILSMTPQGVGINDSLTYQALTDGEFDLVPMWVWIMFGFFYLNAMTVVAWFYTGAGFGLYVNTRTWTEGWDIELKFKGLGRRLGLVLVGLLAFGSAEVRGNEEARRILDSEEFEVRSKPVYEYRDIASEKEKEKKKESSRDRDGSSSRSTSSSGTTAFAGIGSAFFWIIFAIAVAAIVFVVVMNLHVFKRGASEHVKEEKKKVTTVAGMNVEPEKLPEHLVATVRRLWDEGRFKEALGLLYRGAISALVSGQLVEIEESDTEIDCLRRVTAKGEVAHASYFEILTRAWISEAYAKRTPDSQTVEVLCGDWPFGERRAS